MKALVLSLLVSCVTFAAPDLPTRVQRGNFLRVPAYTTLAPVTYYVDGTSGNDTTACTAPGAGACATVAGAFTKIPRLVRHLTTVSVAAGAYAGFVVSGFVADDSLSTTVGLLVTGTVSNSTLASGSATGIATGGSAGSDQTFGTLVDSSAVWTVNDLTGRLLCTSNASPTGTCVPIESNTSTVITVVGSASNTGWVAPVDGVTTYAVQDSVTIINTPVTLPGTPLAAPFANRAAVVATDNYMSGARDGAITFKNLMIANSIGRGIIFGGDSSYALQQMQVRPSTGGVTAAVSVTSSSFGGTSIAIGNPQLSIQNSDIYLSGSTSTVVNWAVPTNLILFGSQIRGNSTNASQFGLLASTCSVDMQAWSIAGTANGMWFTGVGANTIISGGHISCSTYTGSVAITAGNRVTGQGIASQTSINTVDHVQLSVCAIGLLVDGPAAAELHGFTGAVGTTLIEAMNGGYVGVNEANLTTASVQFGDGGSGQYFVDLDNGAVTATSSTDFTTGHCISNLEQGSRACGR